MSRLLFVNARVIFPDRVEDGTPVGVAGGRIVPADEVADAERIDCGGDYLAPGFVDLHVHGGGGADFMDLTEEAFRTVCRTHAHHGTTSLTPTSTVATRDDYRRFLNLCRELQNADTGGARVAGAHLYGPYFFPPAKGCHPAADFVPPADADDDAAGFGPGFPLSVTVAPELLDAETLTRACVARGAFVNVGHSYATFEQVAAAVAWGATHVDHLFCAMSDRARLRAAQPFPMRAGVMEATIAHSELTTEVIADGVHLAGSLLAFAYRMKGPDKLCLVTDAMRAVDCPDGEYWFGSHGRGELIRRRGDAGLTLDGTGLASGVLGMDACVRTMLRATGAPLPEVIRMASRTPARVVGLDRDIGSIAVGMRADLVRLAGDLTVREVFVGGRRVV